MPGLLLPDFYYRGDDTGLTIGRIINDPKRYKDHEDTIFWHLSKILLLNNSHSRIGFGYFKG